MHPPSLRALAASASLVALVAAGVVLPAASASAASVAMTLAVAADGHGPFTDGDEPGGDASDHNGIVRTDDSVVYEVTVNATGGPAVDETFTLRAPADTAWARLPSSCQAEGSSVSGATLTCRIGTLSNASAKVSVVLGVARSAVNGESVETTGSVSANGLDPVAATPPAPVTVSAAPRFDLSVSTVPPSLTPAVGPDGKTNGYLLQYPILLDWKGLVTGDGLLGYERLKGDVSFVDDVSKMFGAGTSTAQLMGSGGAPACGPNTGQFASLPGGIGGGATSVVSSGTFSCTQSAPGQPISVSITGVDSSLSSIPSTALNGGAITGGTRAYVVSGHIGIWVPGTIDNANATATNTFRDLVAPSATNQVDYGSGGEPLGNNAVSRYIGDIAGPGGSLHYFGDTDGASPSFTLSGKFKAPYTTPGQTVHTNGVVSNYSTADWRGSLVCSAFDPSVQSLSKVVSGSYTATSLPAVTGAAQYASIPASGPDSLRDTTCGDGDATWFDRPEDVPGGIRAVDLVRWKLDFPANSILSFNTNLRIDDRLSNGTTTRAYLSVLPGAGRQWVHDTSPGLDSNGPWADFLTLTGDLARITSKVVDEGHDGGDTPDATKYVEQGTTVEFALYPTLTNATPNGEREDVTVRDVLPAGTNFVPGSASIEPTSITDEAQADGSTRQVVTWVLLDEAMNAPIAPITFRAEVKADAPAGPIVNSVSVASPRDVSAEAFRQSNRGLYVLAVGAVGAVEKASPSGLVVGDGLDYELIYENHAASAFDSTDLITVLPFVGDDRGTTTPTRVARAVSPSASETIQYTSTAPKSIVLDAADESNTAGGTTKWCAESDFGEKGCPEALGDATGVRILHASTVAVGATVTHDLALTASSGHGGDVAGSSFGLRVGTLSLPVTSNVATVTMHSGAIGHRAWFDKNGDGLQDPGEPGLADLPVRLTGTDDRGTAVDASTTTDAEGGYRFDDLRPGSYTVAFGTADGGWTKAYIGEDPALDSDVDANGDATATLAAEHSDHDGDGVTGVTSALTVDAGALPKLDPGLPPVVTPPNHGGAIDLRPADGGSHAFTKAPDRLAFTGPMISLWVGTAAALALILGGLALAVRRRRAASPEAPEIGTD